MNSPNETCRLSLVAIEVHLNDLVKDISKSSTACPYTIELRTYWNWSKLAETTESPEFHQ